MTVTMETYFGKQGAGSTSSSIQRRRTSMHASLRTIRPLIFGVPRITFTEGSVSAAGKNQDSMRLTAQASKDPLHRSAPSCSTVWSTTRTKHVPPNTGTTLDAHHSGAGVGRRPASFPYKGHDR
ncbi:hypothetical protein F2981_02510 [Sinorhizobium meliloti]|nr:hypothetical protein [Sinorhizobium meliloti]